MASDAPTRSGSHSSPLPKASPISLIDTVITFIASTGSIPFSMALMADSLTRSALYSKIAFLKFSKMPFYSSVIISLLDQKFTYIKKSIPVNIEARSP
jgi:hypothetical protein